MKSKWQDFSKKIVEHRYSLILFIFLAAASVTGAACVLFMRSFEIVFDHRLDFKSVGAWCWITTPLLFLSAVALVRKFTRVGAAGIPQVVFAAERMSEGTKEPLYPLVSTLEWFVKAVALFIGIWAGASLGPEGPAIHMAACLFFGIIFFLRKKTKLSLDLRSAVIAGGAAGLAAAFNAPLAGVTFAVEELSSDYFVTIKDFVLMSIIVAGIAAKALRGEYTYFGHLEEPSAFPLIAILLIGIFAGGMGIIFTNLLLKGKIFLERFRNKPWYIVPAVLAVALVAIAWMGGDLVLGPGSRAARWSLEGRYESWSGTYAFWKMASTCITYWSGIAGGIFAPCLSMGATLGATVGHWLNVSVAGCALIGMAAFLSGAIQAPITSFVIVFEMSGHHQMLLPIMLASLLAFMVARISGAKHFYQSLADQYVYLLK